MASATTIRSIRSQNPLAVHLWPHPARTGAQRSRNLTRRPPPAVLHSRQHAIAEVEAMAGLSPVVEERVQLARAQMSRYPWLREERLIEGLPGLDRRHRCLVDERVGGLFTDFLGQRHH